MNNSPNERLLGSRGLSTIKSLCWCGCALANRILRQGVLRLDKVRPFEDRRATVPQNRHRLQVYDHFSLSIETPGVQGLEMQFDAIWKNVFINILPVASPAHA